MYLFVINLNKLFLFNEWGNLEGLMNGIEMWFSIIY